jgi:endonuclease/exonuclease/phosphatase family metal-dependent hydrolase
MCGKCPTPRQTARCPLTYPARMPFFSLDRILARPAELIGEIAAVRNSLAAHASDHLPVRTVLNFQRGSPGPTG